MRVEDLDAAGCPSSLAVACPCLVRYRPAGRVEPERRRRGDFSDDTPSLASGGVDMGGSSVSAAGAGDEAGNDVGGVPVLPQLLNATAMPDGATHGYGTATEVREQRARTLDTANNVDAARFRHHRPSPPKLPTVAWINDPARRETRIQSATSNPKRCLERLDRFRLDCPANRRTRQRRTRTHDHDRSRDRLLGAQRR